MQYSVTLVPLLSLFSTGGLGAVLPSELVSPVLARQLEPPQCTTLDQPNPISHLYPNDGTGTANGTVIIIPIDYAVARKIVPSQYPILTKAYESLMPGLPKGKYPGSTHNPIQTHKPLQTHHPTQVHQLTLQQMYLSTAHDHGLILPAQNLSVPDFSRAAMVFPFIDRLNDGHTSFRFGAPILITPNPIVEEGSGVSQETYVGTFDPPCDAYAAVPHAPKGTTYIRAWNGTDQARGKKPSFQAIMAEVGKPKWKLNVYMNITNQILFGQGATPLCDHYTQLFNTSVSLGKFAPRFVRGAVAVEPPYYPKRSAWVGMDGLQVDGAFIEIPGQECGKFAGWRGSGPGDSG